METSIIPYLNVPGLAAVEEVRASYVLPGLEPLATRPVRIIENRNPFRPDERRVVELDPLGNESVAAIVCRAGMRAEDFACSLNGDPLDASALWATVVKPGNEIVLFPRAAGGGSWKGLLGMVSGMIAIGALLFFCPVILAAGAWIVPALFSAGAAVGSAVMSWALAPGMPSGAAFSTTYDPTGPKSLAQPGVPVPKAFGTMGWGGNIISSYVNYAGQDAYINVLCCFGWGTASALTGLLINQKPASTYANCSYFTRLGTNDQTPIDGFSKTVNGYPQETELLCSNGPVVVGGTGTDVQGLEVTIKLPSGLFHISHNGNYVPINVTYKIEVAPHGTNAWTAPLFPRNYGPITTTHTDGSVTWPKWVVLPTDRMKGSGIVYAHDNGSHTPGEAWSQNNNVDVYDYLGHESTVSERFTGEWQPCDSNLGLQQVTGWWEGYRVLQADNTNPFFDTQVVYGLTPGQWDVRVTKIGYQEPGQSFVAADSTDSHYVTDIWLWNVNEVTFSDLAYPNMILVGIHALATSQLSGAEIQIQATITHDLGADTVLPAALAGFEHDNPALVAYDVLTNPLYGMAIAANMIDVPAFVAWAEFCDEVVTNQDGTQARRFVFAGVFDQKDCDAWKTLQTIGNMSRATVSMMGMRYTVVLDAPADPVQLFTVGNTKRDSFQEMWVALDDRCTLIECDFADAKRNWRMDLPVSVMTASDLNSGIQPKVSRTKLIGCTDRDQAWRWAYFHLLSTKLTLRSIQITAPVEAVCCQIGSVIGVQSDVTQWAVGGRIQPGSTLTTLAVDRSDLTFSAGTGWTVSVQHPAVQRGVVTVQSLNGTTITCTTALPAGRIIKAIGPDGTEYIVTGYGGSALTLATLRPVASAAPLGTGQVLTLYDLSVIEEFLVTGWTPNSAPGTGGTLSIAGSGTFSALPVQDSAWAYGQSEGFQPAKLFRVTSIKKSGDFNFEIGALEYNALMYEDPIPDYGEIVGTPDVDATVSNLSLVEIYQNGVVTGTTGSSLVSVGWQPGNTTVGALIQIQANGGPWQVAANIANGNGWSFTGTQGVTYNVSVTGIDRVGNKGSKAATASITIDSSTYAPADVTGFASSPAATTLTLSWNAVAGADHYEIRYTDQAWPVWKTATLLWDGAGTTWTDAVIRTGTYMIVAVSSAASGGLESINPAYSSAYPAPPVVTVTQSTTNPNGSGATSAPAGGVTGVSSGNLTVTNTIWVTVTWTWSASYRAPSGFNVVAFIGDDPTATATYLFDMATVDASARSYTVALAPNGTIDNVNAAVRAIYA